MRDYLCRSLAGPGQAASQPITSAYLHDLWATCVRRAVLLLPRTNAAAVIVLPVSWIGAAFEEDAFRPSLHLIEVRTSTNSKWQELWGTKASPVEHSSDELRRRLPSMKGSREASEQSFHSTRRKKVMTAQAVVVPMGSVGCSRIEVSDEPSRKSLAIRQG
jgi:hypothetical protein